MATAADVRKLAMALEGTLALPHADRTAFRVRRNYATLAPDGKSLNVDLTPDEQAFKVMIAPAIYQQMPNKWGLRGATIVALEQMSIEELDALLRMAWEHGRAKLSIHSKHR